MTWLRFVWLCGYSLWVGGFVFYSGIVQPIIHRELGESGAITRLVTVRLNFIGCLTVVWWWLTFVFDRRIREWKISQAFLLIVVTVTLLLLLGLHPFLGGLVDTATSEVWRPWHRAYLWISPVQFGANVGLLTVS